MIKSNWIQRVNSNSEGDLERKQVGVVKDGR